MASNIYLVVLLLITAGCCVYGHEIPKYLNVCKRSEPNMVDCLKLTIETLRPYLTAGIPDIDVPKLEPLQIGDLLLAEKNKATNGGLAVTATDIVAFGASKFSLKKIEMVEFAKKYMFQIAIPELYVEGRYAFDGMILLLPLKGDGKFNGNFTNSMGTVTVTLDEIQKDGKNHVHVKKLMVRTTVGSGHLNFENLFNGNKEISQILNESINSNFHGYSKEVIPLIEKSLARYCSKVANKVFERFTVEQLFPQN